jgi:hypothetical protein
MQQLLEFNVCQLSEEWLQYLINLSELFLHKTQGQFLYSIMVFCVEVSNSH